MKKKILQTTLFLYHESSLAWRSDLSDFLHGDALSELAQAYPETIVVLGGDGTMLSAIREYSHLEKPFLGINFGSRGHLMNPQNAIKHLQPRAYPLLTGEIQLDDRTISFQAFNEIVCKAGDGRSIKLGYTVQDTDLTSIHHGEVEGDGLMVASYSGSTGYSWAAGGEPLTDHHDRIMTAIAPFAPRDFASIVFSETYSTVITTDNVRNRPVCIYTDGETMLEGHTGAITIRVQPIETSITMYC